VSASAKAEGKGAATAEGRVLRWPPITAETLAVAVVLGLIGVALWQPDKYRGLGDNLIAVTIVVFVVGGMEKLRKLLMWSPRGRSVLRMIGLRPREIDGEP
jgi:hypothetical protein